MFTPQEFEEKLTVTSPPKGWVWVLLGSIVKKWLYENSDTILPIILEHLFGLKKTKQIMRFAIDEEKPDPGTTPPAP